MRRSSICFQQFSLAAEPLREEVLNLTLKNRIKIRQSRNGNARKEFQAAVWTDANSFQNRSVGEKRQNELPYAAIEEEGDRLLLSPFLGSVL